MYRDERYLAYVRGYPCCVCHDTQAVTVHHFGGGGGTALKCDDLLVVPMCPKCHQEVHQSGSVFNRTRNDTQALFWRECALMLAAYAKTNLVD